jgi:hypothetical protein
VQQRAQGGAVPVANQRGDLVVAEVGRASQVVGALDAQSLVCATAAPAVVIGPLWMTMRDMSS